MKEVKLTKVTEAEIQALQQELHLYSEQQKKNLANWNKDDFFDALSTIDIAFRLWVTFRKKIESDNTKFSIRLKVFEAAIVLKACKWNRAGRDAFDVNVAEKYKCLIDQQLKSFVVATEL